MKKIKCYVCLLLAVLFCCSVCACTGYEPQELELIKIPDIEKLDVDTAKTLLAGKSAPLPVRSAKP